MAGIEKYYEITEVYAWQWEENTNITIEDIPDSVFAYVKSFRSFKS